MVLRSTSRPWRVAALRVAMLGGWACWATSLGAGEVGAPAIGTVNTIVVTAKKTPEPVADEEVKRQVETALHSDPYFYGEQVTVTVKDGVVHLQGVVFDDWDLRTARRVSKKIGGVKRIVNELQICSCDGGGGA